MAGRVAIALLMVENYAAPVSSDTPRATRSPSIKNKIQNY